MYLPTHWMDQVDEYENRFTETQNPDGTITHTKVPGRTLQEGTPQDAKHFNNMEDGIMSAQLAALLLAQVFQQQRLVVEKGQIDLTNSLSYPFNNSQKTIALKQINDTTSYTVICTVESSEGPVESIVVSDQLINGFKLAYTGSAKKARINYTVIGGYMS